MTQKQFRNLAAQIIAHEHTADIVKRIYWFKHYARLVSLVRNSNLYGN